MKGAHALRLLLGLVCLGPQNAHSSSSLALQLRRAGTNLTLVWPSTLDVTPGGTVYPEYTLEQSRDLIQWQPVGGRVRGLSGFSGPELSVPLAAGTEPRFYRVWANVGSQTAQETGSGGAEVFG